MIIGADNKATTYDDAKNVTYKGSYQPVQYSILRVEKKFYSLEAIEGWEMHVQRETEVENADSTKTYENKILIGDANIYENLKQRIKSVKTRKDSCIARDLVLTCSPSFFKNLSKGDFETWQRINVEWLKKTYGDNCIYAVLHLDETTAHLHVLVSVDYVNKKGIRVMSNNNYFGGKVKLSDLQTNYSDHMRNTFKVLSRGLKGSKAHHTTIKQWYALVTKPLNEKDMESVKAYARKNELTEIKLKKTQKTLNAYVNYQDARDKEKVKMEQQNTQMFDNLVQKKKNDELFKDSMKAISKLYKIPQSELLKIVGACKDKVKEQDREK